MGSGCVMQELSLVLCDKLEGWAGVGGEREVQKRGAYVYLGLIHVVVWQKPTQHWKAIIFQLKKKLKESWDGRVSQVI